MSIKREKLHALFKKTFISLSLILLLLNANVSHFNKAKASGADITESPSYVDEMFKAVMTGVMTAAGAAAHAGNYVEDNLKSIVDAAGLTYNQLAPEMKQAFKDSMTAAGDRIVITGDFINNFLSTYEASSKGSEDLIPLVNVGINGIGLKSGYYAMLTYIDANKQVKQIKTSNIMVDYFQGELVKMSGGFWHYTGNSNLVEAFNSSYVRNPTAEGFFSFLSSAGMILSIYSESNALIGTVDNTTVTQDPIYDQVDRWLRDRAEAGGLSLGLPQSVPYTNTGLKLGVNENLGGLTLDGSNLYTGDIVWRDVLPNVSEGALTLPAPFIYNPTGLPLALVDGIPIAPDGSIVKPTDVTVSANPVTHVTDAAGNVTTVTNTYTGSTVNTITNEWITYNTYVYEVATGTVIPKPETPPKKPEKKPESNDGTPNSLLLALLLAMLDLIRAIIWYLIRLFNFVVQLPKTPSMEIPNPVFQWFISAKFVGINVYQSAVYLTTFALSFGVFKVIRRYFND